MVVSAPVRIFISYRRQDAGHLAGRLYDRLVDQFGEEHVFMDVDSIGLGSDFVEVITHAVRSCDVLLAIIGPNWVARDGEGRSRLDNPNDLVRLEIEAALARDILVIPILMEGTVMPRLQDVPPSLTKLIHRNALPIGHASFRSDTDRLLEALQRKVGWTPVSAGVPPSSHGLRTHLAKEVRHGPKSLLSLKGVNHVDISPDGGRLVSAGGNNIARIWTLPDGASLLQVAHDDWIDGAVFSPDGRWLATGSNDKTACIWDASSGVRNLVLSHSEPVRAVAFSPDGRWLATGSNDKTVGVWNVLNGARRLQLAHKGGVCAAAFSPDGRWLATGGLDKSALLWNLADGSQRLNMAHKNPVLAVAFTPDGRWLATASSDKTAGVWNTADGSRQLKLDHRDSVYGVAVSPEGQWLVTGTADNLIWIWRLSSI